MTDSSDSDKNSESESSEEEEENEEEEVDHKKVLRPKTIKGTTEFVDISFHPSLCYMLATADMSGFVRMYNCVPGEESNEKIKKRISKEPCRCLAFSQDGDELFALSKDEKLRLICTTTGSLKRKIDDVHDSSPYCIKVVDKNIFVTGDEDGTLKIWDLRRGNQSVMEDKKFDNYISDITVDDKQKLIFAVSGEGSMATYNVRQRRFKVQSQNEKIDLLCCQVIKYNKKVIVGAADGPLYLYNWDEFAAPSDTLRGHRGSVDCFAKLTEDIICTASSDGKIRAVNILPNKFVGVVGDHGEMSVEKVRATHDKSFLASISHDSVVKFWNVDHLQNITVKSGRSKHCKNKSMPQSGVKPGKHAFYSDLDKDLEIPPYEVDSDDVSSSEETKDDEMEADLVKALPSR